MATLDSKLAVKALAALAHETRLAVFRLLVTAGRSGMSPGAIAEKLGLPAPTLSFHLKELAHAELIEGKSQGGSSSTAPAMTTCRRSWIS